jgi:two-component system sensor histidine kinase UhpB
MSKEYKSYHLLVVEDNPGDYLLLEKYLELSNLPIKKIVHAANLMAVPPLAKDTIFDIILLDLTLPDSTGVDSVITLDRLFPQTPIIVFSGLSSVEIAVESISVGAQDYLIKGEFDEKLLAKSVQYGIERKRTTEKLRESNERYEFVNKATQDTVWEWNLHTNEIIWSHGISAVFGYLADEIRKGYDWWYENIHPSDKERVGNKLQYYIKNNIEKWEDEYRYRTASGLYKYVLDRGYVLFNASGKPFRMIGAMTDLTEKKELEEELIAQQLKQQKIITETTIQAQEKERNEIGKELHDNIIQILATVKMYLGLIKSGHHVPEDLVGKSYEYVNNAMEEIRKLSHSLVAPSLGDIGLKEALQELVEDTNLLNGLQVHLSVDEMYNEKNMDKSKELMLYRIVQEQLTNITKHAKAEKAVITLKRENNNLFLSVVDNGTGFDISQKSKGIGLKNISSRVEFYSGNINIISTPGQGCTLEVCIPY